MDYEWTPLERVGVFTFNRDIAEFVNYGLLVRMPDDQDATGWETYAVPGQSVRVHAENGRIISIACYDACTLCGRNLIGLEFDETKRLIGLEPSEEPDTIYINGEPQQVFEFDEVEAQIWVKAGKVVTIFCGTHQRQ